MRKRDLPVRALTLALALCAASAACSSPAGNPPGGSGGSGGGAGGGGAGGGGAGGGGSGGGSGGGAASPIQVLYSFDGATGADPKGSLTWVATSAGPALFGRTAFGGSSWSAANPADNPGGGVIFSLPLGAGSASTYSFTSAAAAPTSGYQPHHDSMILLGSSLYGTTLFTGAISTDGAGLGGLFIFNPALTPPACASAVSTPYCGFYDFTGSANNGPDGASAHSTFGVGSNQRVLYGATAQGGTHGDGTLYAVSLASALPSYSGVLMSLHDTATGKEPHGRPIVVSTGAQDVLLGITKAGGAAGYGAVYACVPNGNSNPTSCAYSLLHSFTGPGADGATSDHGNLTVVTPPANNLVTVYGMTTNGGTGTQSGSSGDGVIFTLGNLPLNPPAALSNSLPVCTAGGTATCYSVLHDFGGSVEDVNGRPLPDGYNPYGSLLATNGFLYGMTRNGGANGQGVIFRIAPDGSGYLLLASFDGNSDNASGNQPIDNLIASPDGSTLYGLTQQGGANDRQSSQPVGFGTVFSIPAAPMALQSRR